MAWELRGKGRFYYQSVRVGGKVQRRYLGSGEAARTAAAEDAARRAERETQAQARRDEVARWAVLEARLDELCLLGETVLTAALVLHGFHRHDRGSWRKRRDVNNN